jgi:hypothetical protein
MTARGSIGISFAPIPPDADQWRIIEAVVDALLPLGDDPGAIATARRVKEQVSNCFSGLQNGATARTAIRALITQTSRSGDEAQQVLASLVSDRRLNMAIRTAVRMAQAMRDWRDGQQKSTLLVWPAAEFYFAEGHDEPRDWNEVWRRNGGRFFPGSAKVSGERMIALKDDSVWLRINAFGLPFSPFDLESGMDTRDIDVDEAEGIGLLGPSNVVLPPTAESIRNYLDALDVAEVVRARFKKYLAGTSPD